MNYHKWHAWFAWRPVRLGVYGPWRWLVKVERRREEARIPGVSPSDWWEYR